MLEYAYVIHAVKNVPPQKKKNHWKNSDISKYRVKQEKNKWHAAKVNKTKTKHNRESLDNSFDIEIISGYIDKLTEASLNLLQNLTQMYLLLLSPLPS